MKALAAWAGAALRERAIRFSFRCCGAIRSIGGPYLVVVCICHTSLASRLNWPNVAVGGASRLRGIGTFPGGGSRTALAVLTGCGAPSVRSTPTPCSSFIAGPASLAQGVALFIISTGSIACRGFSMLGPG